MAVKKVEVKDEPRKPDFVVRAKQAPDSEYWMNIGVAWSFKDGKPDGPPQDVVTRFLNSNDEARGRPVGLAVDKAGGLLIADDLGDTVWRVTSAP